MLPAGTAGMPCPVEVCWLCPSVWLDEAPLLSPETLLTGEFSSAIMMKRTEVDTEVWLGCKHLWGGAIGEICIYQLLIHVTCADHRLSKAHTEVCHESSSNRNTQPWCWLDQQNLKEKEMTSLENKMKKEHKENENEKTKQGKRKREIQ